MAEQRVRRRLAAILAADVVGYSRMMGADEAGTLARLNSLRQELLHPKVSEYGGRIVKTTGDGTLIEFPSAVDAVQHAVDVQRALARRNAPLPEGERIEIRIGINLGDVIVEGEDIFGEGVNIAARLEGLAQPGGVCVSAIVRDSVRTKLDIDFVDLGEKALKNIAEPVRVFDVDLGSGTSEVAPIAEALLRRPAVAVLPFENLSGDPEQEYFADGLTEDIITALSQWRTFPVIARNSTFAYKGRSPDVRKVGMELGARYVIEGSVRKGGSRVRVTAQLINSETGLHIWAERYDRDLEDVFELQDEIARRIAGIVAPELERAETKRPPDQVPKDLEAWDCCLRGRALLAAFDAEENKRARTYFERAIELEPGFSQAYAGLARSHYREIFLEPARNRESSVANALAAARRAVDLDRTNAFAHLVLAIAHHYAGEYAPSVSEAEAALALNPSDAQAYFTLGLHLSTVGRPEEGLRNIAIGFRLNPYEPGNYVYFCMMAHAQFTARHYDEAVEWARKAEQLRPEIPEVRIILAAALGHLERAGEARRELDACQPLDPHINVKGGLLDWQHEADQRHFLDGLRKAGWDG